jgi:hypothetical protein
MATDQPHDGQPAPEQPAPRAAPRVSRHWHESDAAPQAKQTRATSKKRKKIFVVLACMVAIALGILAFLRFVNPFHPPAFFAVALTEYAVEDFPVNAFAQRDSAALVECFEDGTPWHNFQEKRLLQDKLDSLKRIADKPVVLYLCGFARVSQGTLYLLPAHAKPGDPASWLAMDDVLRPLRECKAAHKLLILDIFRLTDDPLRATLPDDVAGAFQDLFQSKEQGNLQVFCACSRGQTSLVSEELSQSVFGYYLDQGLRGFADGYNPDRKRDGRVSLQELTEFVQARVERWVRRSRGLRQTPVLLGKGSNFDLVSLERGEPQAKPKAPPLAPYPGSIQDAWQLRDAWLADRTYELAPEEVHRLEMFLLRQEQRWRGHDKIDDIDRDVRVELSALRTKVSQARPEAPSELYSLTLKESRGLLKTEAALDKEHREALAEVDKALRAAIDGVDDKTDSKELPKRQMQFAMRIDKLMKNKPAPEQILWKAMQVVLDDDTPCSELAQFKLLVSLLPDQPPSPEMAFLQRLAGFKPDEKGWPKQRVQQLLQVFREGEKAHACRPRELPWVRPALAAALAKRLKGDELFFTYDSDKYGQARDLWGEALDKYKDINAQIQAVREAQSVRDEAVRLLPAYLPCLVARYRLSEAGELQRVWTEALKLTRQLDDSLAVPPGDKVLDRGEMADQREALSGVTGRLKGLLRTLREPLREVDPKKVMASAGPEDEDNAVRRTIRALVDVESILATSWPSAAQRKALWGNRAIFARDLNRKVEALDNTDNEDERITPAPRDAGEISATQLEGERAFRTRLYLGLLKFAGLDKGKLDRLEAMLGKTAGAKPDPKAWDALAAALGSAWSGQLPAELHKALRKENDLRREEVRQYWNALAKAYSQQAQGLADQPGLRKVFQNAAQEFAGFAG